jgi:hypothetical protein
MQGYIHYDKESIYSPYYPYEIGVWRSPHHAIEDGQDPYSTILLFVSMRRDLFMPMRDYIFVGDYGDLITRAIEEIYIPKMEMIDVSSYIYPISRDIHIPTITVSRFSYILEEKGNVYRQSTPIPVIDEYEMGIIPWMVDGKEKNVKVYIGRKGSFILLDKIPHSL